LVYDIHHVLVARNTMMAAKHKGNGYSLLVYEYPVAKQSDVAKTYEAIINKYQDEKGKHAIWYGYHDDMANNDINALVKGSLRSEIVLGSDSYLMAKKGALFAVTPNFDTISEQLKGMIVTVQNDKPAGIRTTADVVTIINKRSAYLLDLEVEELAFDISIQPVSPFMVNMSF